MRNKWIYILLLLFTACVKETDWEPSGEAESYIVVDGIITNEAKNQSISIHYNYSDLNEEAERLSGASVIISNEDNTYQLAEDPENQGTYLTDSIVVAQFNKNYSLLILHGEKVYSAQAYMAPGKSFPELVYKKNEGDELYHISYVASSFEASDPAMWEVIIDWSGVEGYEHLDDDDCIRRLLFYTLPTLDVSQIFAPVVEQVFFPAGTNIEERRYSLTQEHAAFIRTLLLETSWQGGVFPSDPANVTTNLSEGALGYFGVCAVNSLSLTVTP